MSTPIRHLPTATPAEIDARWSEISARRAALLDEVERIEAESHELGAEYASRGRWTRTYLVTGGHLHRSTSCSTCFPTTQYHWLTNLSGMTEAELVEMAGERACTVCYPSAPVEVLRRKSTLFTPEEEAAEAARAEREAKRAAAAAASITVEGLSDWGRVETTTFKSDRAVSNRLASTLKDVHFYRMNTDEGRGHPSEPEWLTNADKLAAALAEVRGTSAAEVLAEANSKAEARARKEYEAAKRRFG